MHVFALLFLTGCVSQDISALEHLSQYWAQVRQGDYVIEYERYTYINDLPAEYAHYWVVKIGNKKFVKMQTDYGIIEYDGNLTCLNYMGQSACEKGDVYHLERQFESEPQKELYVLKYLNKKRALKILKQNSTFIEYEIDYSPLTLQEIHQLNLSAIKSVASKFTIARWFDKTGEKRRVLQFQSNGKNFKIFLNFLTVGKNYTVPKLNGSNQSFYDLKSQFDSLKREWYSYAIAKQKDRLETLAISKNIIHACPDDRCKLQVMLRWDIMNCDKISLTDDCYFEFAVKHRDKDLCYRVQNITKRKQCLKVVP